MNFQKHVVLVMASLFVIALGGCASVPLQPEGTAEERQARLEQLQQFSFSGGLGIQSDQQSITGRIQWQQFNDELAVELRGPLGLGRLNLDYENAFATLSRGRTILAQGVSLDGVVQRGLGLAAPVPIDQLRQWIKGLPGDATLFDNDEQGKLSELSYTDAAGVQWQAQFLKYRVVDGIILPALITATGGPYNVRVALNDWELSAASAEPEETRSNTRLAIPSR